MNNSVCCRITFVLVDDDVHVVQFLLDAGDAKVTLREFLVTGLDEGVVLKGQEVVGLSDLVHLVLLLFEGRDRLIETLLAVGLTFLCQEVVRSRSY